MAVAFSLLGLFPLVHGSNPMWWALFVAFAFFALSFLYAKGLEKPKLVWLKFGELLHKITSPIILGFMFFVVVTPMAILLRAFGKDLLSQKLDSSSESYWVQREPPGPEPQGMDNQF